MTSFAVYFNALYNGFVYDDELHVLENPWIRDVRYLPDIFSKNMLAFKFASATNFYRPLMHVVYMFNYHVFGLAPWGFHFVNILFHVANTLLLFILLTRILGGPPAIAPRGHEPLVSVPILSALLFSVHPIHTEAVVWVSGITDLSFTFFALLSFYWLVKPEAGRRSRLDLLPAISFLLALLCKESAVVLIPVLAAHDLASWKAGERRSVLAVRYGPLLLALVVYFVLRRLALGRFITLSAQDQVSPYQHMLGAVSLFARYLQKLLLPLNLNAYCTLSPVTSPAGAAWMLALGATVCFLVLACLTFRRSRTAFLGLTLLGIPLIPPIVFFPSLSGGAPFAERYLYLPSAGFALLVSALFVWMYGKLRRHGIALIAGVIVLVALYSFQTVRRNRDWKDMIVLCTDTIRKSPDAELPRGNLGNALLDAGRVDESIEQFMEVTTRINPNSENAYYNLGRALKKKGRLSESIKAYEKAISLDPADRDAHHNLAVAYAQAGMFDEAAREYGIFLDRATGPTATLVMIGLELERDGLGDPSVDLYRKALTLDPNHFAAHYMLGNSFLRSGLLDATIEHLSAAAGLQPDNPICHNLLGIAYGRKGMYAQAIEHFQAAVRLSPDEPSYRQNLEKAIGSKGSAG